MKENNTELELQQVKQANSLKNNHQKEPKKGKTSLLKKKKVFGFSPGINVSLKHIVNIHDIWFINEETLRNPEGTSENILRAMFRYKMISKIVLNASFVGLQLKKIDDNYLPPQYFFQRFRSFGDRQIAAIANDLESMYITLNENQSNQKEETQQIKHEQAILLLNDFLLQMEGKMFIIYFVQFAKFTINLKHIFFSVFLLEKLGWNIKRVAGDFIKYRHVFFEIFSPKFYKNYISLCLNNYLKAQQLEKDPTLTREQKIQMTTVFFEDQLVRQVQTQNGVHQELLKTNVKFYSPHSSFCCVEFLKIDDNPTENFTKKIKLEEKKMQMSAEEQINQLKKLGFETDFMELEDTAQTKIIADPLDLGEREEQQ